MACGNPNNPVPRTMSETGALQEILKVQLLISMALIGLRNKTATNSIHNSLVIIGSHKRTYWLGNLSAINSFPRHLLFQTSTAHST